MKRYTRVEWESLTPEERAKVLYAVAMADPEKRTILEAGRRRSDEAGER